jgi:putative Mg2+ transporter-C (MgtC) family protein
VIPSSPAPEGIAAVLRVDLLLKLLLAVCLGGAIGMEREIAGKPAGLRTNILICIAATVIMDLSMRISTGPEGQRWGDPARLAAQALTGVGFIGAGTILHARGTVTGLTSAATIWMVTAIGLSLGAGYFVEALGAGVLVIATLSGLGRVEYYVRRWRRIVAATIRTAPGYSADDLRHALGVHGVFILDSKVFDHPEDRTWELKLAGPARQFDILAGALNNRRDILSVQLGDDGN